jgi:hypothetical protein
MQDPKTLGVGDHVVLDDASARDVEDQCSLRLLAREDDDSGTPIDGGDTCSPGVSPKGMGLGNDSPHSPDSQCLSARKGLRVSRSNYAWVEERDQAIGVTPLGGIQEGLHHALRLLDVSRWTAGSLAKPSSRTAGQLLGRPGSRSQHMRYLIEERRTKHIVKDERNSLRRRQLVEHDHERLGQLTRKKSQFFWFIASAYGRGE